MADIFVSYASEDRDRIQPLVERLEGEGWSVWWDRELVTGPSFDTKIEEALDAAKCVVVAWSRHSIDSRWVRTEANEGLERNVLVPVLIDDVRPPLAFRMSQTADLSGWPRSEGELSSLLQGVSELLGSTAAVSVDVNHARSIAVLPFANMSSDPEQEFFGDGIAEEVIGGLVNWGKLKVIARTSSFKFKGQSEDVRTIGRILGVTHVLEGSVRKSGDRLRVTAQLIDAGDGAHLWSERFDRQQSDVFEMQDEITAAIVSALQGELAPSRRRSAGTRNVEAYQFYVNGRFHLAQGSNLPTYLAALKELRQAIEIDPDFADAHGALSTTYFGLGFWNPPVRMDRIEESMTRALALDPEQPDARLTEASLFLYRDHDIHKALAAWDEILRERPTDVLALYRRYIGLMSLGIDDVDLLDRMLELDPLFQTHYRHRAAAHMRQDSYDKAIADAERALELDDKDPFAIMIRGRCGRLLGDESLLQDSVEKMRSVVGERNSMYAQLTDDRVLGRQILDDPDTVRFNPPSNLAVLASWVGDDDLAMMWFSRGMERGDFASIQQCRAWMRGPNIENPEERERRYRAIQERDDYQEILRRFNLDDESVSDLLASVPGRPFI